MSTFNIEKILVPLDFSRASMKALDYAVEISKATTAEIILLHVSEGFFQNREPNYFIPPVDMADYEELFVKQSNTHLQEIAEKIGKKKIGNVKTLTVTGGIHAEILNTAKKEKVSLIVMGTHGVTGFKEFFAGSNTFRIVRDAKCPVLSVQQKNPAPAFKNILVPFRDKPHSREKVNYAIDLALKFSSTIHVLGVDNEFTESHKKKITREAEQIRELVHQKGIKCSIRVISNAYVGDTVLKYGQSKKADLIISMADLDKMNIAEYFTGPFAQQIVNHSTIPVFSIRPQFNTDTIDLRFY